MRRFTIAAVAVLAIAGSTAVYAQRGWFHDHMHHARMNPEDRAAMLDARIASVHAGLKLTADQEKLWPPVESAVRDLVKLRFDRANARMKAADEAQDKDVDPVARLRERADTMAVTADAMKKVADAADPLYKTLDDGQKRRLSMLTRPMGRMMGPDGLRHHRWMERGEGGMEDGPRFGEHRFGPGPMGHMGWSEEERESGRL
ncbi:MULTISPECIES: Spy/CpxP family protein refolding chaperone [unclassified Bradyrhizobium]|uniref:Spy/CpxP family protein refolding chaperone n=1 Tax=unclassified Bradyrhizobium TaxID=2631580 RepID=UPI0028E436D4|nr:MULTISPECIES: Spy/CpxP family protein refolding chaperone [unclassified Bradyrhizobium]